MNKTVTIITPVYNASQFIRVCMDSVLAQTYTNWELILSDDCSTDNSVEIIEEYKAKDNRIKLIRSSVNNGAGVARNKAIEQASGRFMAFLDSDDFWHKEKLKKQLQFMSDGNFGIVFCQYFVVVGNSSEPEYKICSPKRVNYRKMLNNDFMGFLTVLYDTAKIKKQLMPQIRRRQDWAYKLRLLRETEYAFGLQEPLAFYRIGNSSLSSNKLKLLKYNFSVYHNELGYSRITSFILMINFLFHYFYFKITSKKSLI